MGFTKVCLVNLAYTLSIITLTSSENEICKSWSNSSWGCLCWERQDDFSLYDVPYLGKPLSHNYLGCHSLKLLTLILMGSLVNYISLHGFVLRSSINLLITGSWSRPWWCHHWWLPWETLCCCRACCLLSPRHST